MLLTKHVVAAFVALGVGSSVGLIFSSGASVSADATTTSLPADQIVINGSCFSQGTITADAQAALKAWAANPSLGPAALVVNGSWVPADVALRDPYGMSLCMAKLPTTTTTASALVLVPTGPMVTSLPADQIVVNGSCLSQATITADAQAALKAWAANPSLGPAGLIVNGNWVQADMALRNPYGMSLCMAKLPTTTATLPTPTT